MKIDLQIKGLESVQKHLKTLAGPQMRTAYAKAVTDTAYQAQRAIQKTMRDEFDKPTSYVMKSVLVDHATPENLSARVAPKHLDPSAIDPQKILQAQENGGARRIKRYEVALRTAGVLPVGFQTAIPETPYPGSSDGRGNLRGIFMIKLLNYFQANQAAMAAMSKRRRSSVNRSISYGSAMSRVNGRLMDREVRLLDGAELFVSDGRGRLAAGIWARRAGRAGELKPVLIFTRVGIYRPRLGMERIAKNANLQAYLERRLRYQIREAVGV